VILVSHHAGNLVQVGQIVHGPCRKQLRECYGAERRVQASRAEIVGLQVQPPQLAETLGAQLGERVQQLS
jgi:hypothetical protein